MRTGPGLIPRATREYQPANRRENNITRRHRFTSCLLSVEVELDQIIDDEILLPLDNLSAISTFRLTDAGPMMSDCQPRRDPGVRCSRFVSRCHDKFSALFSRPRNRFQCFLNFLQPDVIAREAAVFRNPRTTGWLLSGRSHERL